MTGGTPLRPQGARLGGFEIVRSLGDGGFGEVFLARRDGAAGFQRSVALKRLKDSVAADPELVSLFGREAQICGFLHHPNVIEVYDFIESSDGFLLVMELLDGQELRRILKTFHRHHKGIPLRLCVEIIRQLSSGLEAVHYARDAEGKSLGLIHRDIKPANLMLTRQGQVKIMDFGIARADFARTETGAQTLKGTVRYMAPEQAMGHKLDARVDQFAAGLILGELITGRPIYHAPTPALLNQKVLLGNVADGLRDVEVTAPTFLPLITRALAHNPEDRFEDLAAFRLALARLVDDLPLAPDLSEVVSGLMDRRDVVDRYGRPLVVREEGDEEEAAAPMVSLVMPTTYPTSTIPTQGIFVIPGMASPGENPTPPAEVIRAPVKLSAIAEDKTPPLKVDSPPVTRQEDPPLVMTPLPEERPTPHHTPYYVAAAILVGIVMWWVIHFVTGHRSEVVATRLPESQEVVAPTPVAVPASTTEIPPAEIVPATPAAGAEPRPQPSPPTVAAPTPARMVPTPAPPPQEERAVAAPPPVVIPPARGKILLRTVPASHVSRGGEPLSGLDRQGVWLPAGKSTLTLQSFDGQVVELHVDVVAGHALTYRYSFTTGQLEQVADREELEP